MNVRLSRMHFITYSIGLRYNFRKLLCPRPQTLKHWIPVFRMGASMERIKIKAIAHHSGPVQVRVFTRFE